MVRSNIIIRNLNKIISKANTLRYVLIEPLLLRNARKKYSSLYKNYDNPLVSIIIATYNRSNILINRTIPSLINQTYKNIEIVVIGDHCIDDTALKITRILDPRVKFYDLSRRGKYPRHIKDRWFVQGTKPRNIGMQLASGLWFVFISDDEILYPHHIETLLTAAQQGNLEFISAAYEEEREGLVNKVLPLAFDPTKPNLICGGMQTWMYRSYLKIFKWNIHSWRKTFNRPVDYDLVIRFNSCGIKMGYIENVVGLNPVVEGTDTVGYLAALQADTSN
jgi:glycosyltransferase involved in cell wall biosynthesis